MVVFIIYASKCWFYLFVSIITMTTTWIAFISFRIRNQRYDPQSYSLNSERTPVIYLNCLFIRFFFSFLFSWLLVLATWFLDICYFYLSLLNKYALGHEIYCFPMQLLQKYADETGHLNPPHRFVPWLVVNNQPLQEVVLSNFLAFLISFFLSMISFFLSMIYGCS